MILLYTLLAVFLIVVIAITIMLVFGLQENKYFRNGISVGAVICAFLFFSCVIYSIIVSGNINILHADYNNLMLYYNTVNYSTNEYVRYDYYNKVMEFNNKLEYYQEGAADPWWGGLYPKNWDVDINPIDFQLHGDEYVEFE